MISPDPAVEPPEPEVCAPGSGDTLRTPPSALLPPSPIQATRAEEYASLDWAVHCLAENVNDIETTRIGVSHRLVRFVDEGATEQELAVLQAVHDQLLSVETFAVKELEKAMKTHPLYPWVARSKGVGRKQAARLLSAIGNPYWNHAQNRPRRGPAELWAYCGYHVLPLSPSTSETHQICAEGQPPLSAGQASADAPTSSASGQNIRATPPGHSSSETHLTNPGGVAPKRRRGQRANWNSAARTRAYLIATQCIKTDGDYRKVYDHGRDKYEHLPKGHAHNRALRLVAKEVLKDIYLEARAWHLDGEDPDPS